MTELNQQNSLLGKIAAYTEILAKDPRSTIFVSLGEAYRKMGMLDDARAVIEKGLRSLNDFSPAYIVLGRVFCQQGDYSGSVQAFEQALEYDPESLAALVGYARVCILLERTAKARDLLLTARALSPADPVINKLLLSLPEESKNQEPLETQESLSDGPEKQQPTAGLEEQDDVQESETETSEPPVLVSATLADLYLKQGLSEKALNVYRQLSNQEPDNLLYRRQIRDLEEQLAGPDQVVEEVPTTDTEPVAAEDVFQQESVPQAEEHSIPELDSSAETMSVESSATDLDDDQVILTLNRWLESIQRRRNDV